MMSTFPGKGNSTSFVRRHVSRTPIAMAVAVALLKQPIAVYAADAVADQPTIAAQSGDLQEIVVTGTRRSLDIQNVPFNLAAVTSDMIQEAQMTRINDLISYLPGVSVFAPNNSDSTVPQIITRGLNVAGLDPAGGGPTGVGGAVITYFGEVPMFFPFRLLDIDRVEALLGPQGTLYGAGTLGGVIRYIPKEPNLTNFEGDLHIRGTAQEHATPGAGYDGDGVVNVPLIDGVLGFRAAVGYTHVPGFMDDTRLVRQPGVSLTQPNFNDPSAVAANLYTEKGVNFDHAFTARGELLYKPSDSFRAEVTYMHQRSNTDGPNVTVPAPIGTGPYSEGYRVPDKSTLTIDLVSLVLTENLGFANLTSSSSYATQKQRTDSYDATDSFVTSTAYTNFPRFVAYDAGDLYGKEQYVEELRLVSSGQSRWNWILGGFYQYYNLYQSSGYTYTPGYPAYLGLPAGTTDLDYYANAQQRFTDKAVFGEVGYQFTDAWQMLVGARWFKDEINATNSSEFPISGTPLKVTNLRGPAIDTAIYKFNTSYRFTPDLMLYATIDDGYRAGTINVQPECPAGVTHDATGCLQPDQLTSKPDRTRNFEMGMRSTWFDKRLLFNAGVYYIKWRDLRVPCMNFNVSYLCNGSGAISKGLETQFQAQLPLHLSLLGNYTHSEAYLSAPLPNVVQTLSGERFDGTPGMRLPGTPRDYGALHLRYSGNLPNDYTYYASYGITAQSNVFNGFGGTLGGGEITGGYAVQDASLSVSKSGKWTATFFVDNLLNRYAWTGSTGDYGYAGYVDPTNGFIYRGYYHSVLPPRTFGVEYSVHFGPKN